MIGIEGPLILQRRIFIFWISNQLYLLNCLTYLKMMKMKTNQVPGHDKHWLKDISTAVIAWKHLPDLLLNSYSCFMFKPKGHLFTEVSHDFLDQSQSVWLLWTLELARRNSTVAPSQEGEIFYGMTVTSSYPQMHVHLAYCWSLVPSPRAQIGIVLKRQLMSECIRALFVSPHVLPPIRFTHSAVYCCIRQKLLGLLYNPSRDLGYGHTKWTVM